MAYGIIISKIMRVSPIITNLCCHCGLDPQSHFILTMLCRGRTPVRPALSFILRDAQGRVPYEKNKFPDFILQDAQGRVPYEKNKFPDLILRDAQGRVPYIKNKFPDFIY